jgi:hypothetical protein
MLPRVATCPLDEGRDDERTSTDWPPNLAVYGTTDREQAERWRNVVAEGGWPDDLPQPVIIRGDAAQHFPG